MAAQIKIPTLSTVLVVEDSQFPATTFAVDGCDKKGLYQYVRLDILPEELKEAVKKAILIRVGNGY